MDKVLGGSQVGWAVTQFAGTQGCVLLPLGHDFPESVDVVHRLEVLGEEASGSVYISLLVCCRKKCEQGFEMLC